MAPSQERKWPWRTQSNVASDHAQIGIQGTVIGDVRYEISGDDPPGKKYAVAKNCLAGKMPRRAKQLIDEVIEVGFVTESADDSLANEVAYHLTIAVLSDRSFELLEKEEFDDLERARLLCRDRRLDEWGLARTAVTGLIACLQRQERTGVLDHQALDAFFTEFDRLSTKRRDEIRRHLDLILTGVLQDRLDASFAEVVSAERAAGRRTERVWKFFEPVPEPPRPKIRHKVEFDLFERIANIWGCVLAAGGLYLMFAYIFRGSVPKALISLALLLMAGSTVVGLAPATFPKRYSALSPRRPRPKPTAFSEAVRRSVQREFDKRAPRAFAERSTWTVATLRLRTTLTEEIVDLYSEPEVTPGSVDWLIAWYAEDAARKWSNGELTEPSRWLKVLGVVAGLFVLGLGWFLAFSAMSAAQPETTFVAVVWLVGGVGLLLRGRADVAVARYYTRDAAKLEADRWLAAETAAYDARLELLSDRPDDAEMARWLDYDTIYLKTLAMNQYGLSNRDVVAHAVLTEAMPTARRARVAGGQPRFSSYLVWIFLLTVSGARYVAMQLDFPTGIASEQDRTAFRYDAITSARVTEVGIRFDDGRRQVILPHTDDGEKRKIDRSSLIIYQLFRLSFADQNTFHIKVEDFDAGLLDELADDDDPRLAPDLSDLTGALGLLEAVAADGGRLVEQAKKRQGHRPLTEERDLSFAQEINGGGVPSARRHPDEEDALRLQAARASRPFDHEWPDDGDGEDRS